MKESPQMALFFPELEPKVIKCSEERGDKASTPEPEVEVILRRGAKWGGEGGGGR
jgi:hypothetical protein